MTEELDISREKLVAEIPNIRIARKQYLDNFNYLFTAVLYQKFKIKAFNSKIKSKGDYEGAEQAQILSEGGEVLLIYQNPGSETEKAIENYLTDSDYYAIVFRIKDNFEFFDSSFEVPMASSIKDSINPFLQVLKSTNKTVKDVFSIERRLLYLDIPIDLGTLDTLLKGIFEWSGSIKDISKFIDKYVNREVQPIVDRLRRKIPGLVNYDGNGPQPTNYYYLSGIVESLKVMVYQYASLNSRESPFTVKDKDFKVGNGTTFLQLSEKNHISHLCKFVKDIEKVAFDEGIKAKVKREIDRLKEQGG